MESYKTQGQVEHTVHQTKIRAMEDKEQGRECRAAILSREGLSEQGAFGQKRDEPCAQLWKSPGKQVKCRGLECALHSPGVVAGTEWVLGECMVGVGRWAGPPATEGCPLLL